MNSECIGKRKTIHSMKAMSINQRSTRQQYHLNEMRVSATTHNPVTDAKTSIKKLNIKSVSNDD